MGPPSVLTKVERPGGYLAAVLGGLGGALAARLAGYLFTIAAAGRDWDINLGLAAALVGLLVLTPWCGAIVGCGLAVRRGGHRYALRTALAQGVLLPPCLILLYVMFRQLVVPSSDWQGWGYVYVVEWLFFSLGVAMSALAARWLATAFEG